MEQETIKILCTDCEKRNVCMYKDEFELIVAQTEQIKKASIHKIIVECMEYRKTKPTQRNVNEGNFNLSKEVQKQMMEQIRRAKS